MKFSMDDSTLMFIISIMIIIFNQELVKEVVGLRRSVEEQGKKLADLENYIDTLVRQFFTHEKNSNLGNYQHRKIH